MGNLALSEMALSKTGKFSYLNAVENMLLALSIRKKKSLEQMQRYQI